MEVKNDSIHVIISLWLPILLSAVFCYSFYYSYVSRVVVAPCVNSKRLMNVKKKARGAISLLKSIHPHFIFIVSVISLALLAAWWATFINQSIERNRTHTLENLRLSLSLLAFELGNGSSRPAMGVYEPDNRFEVAPYRKDQQSFSSSLRPAWPDLCLKTRDPVLAEIARDFKRKKIMVTGESGVLVLVILISSILLYRFIKLEKRTVQEVESFWGRVTHEIKTPITGIKAFLQSLKNKSIDPAQLPYFVDMALKQVERQEQLAGNILAGYNLRSGKRPYPLHLENLNLNQRIREYFSSHGWHLTDAELRILPLSPGKDIIVTADNHFWRIILDNIIDNAQKYCSPGLILEVNIFEHNGQAVLAIKDNGPGLDPGMTRKIFQAFKYPPDQLPVTTAIPHGSGMGLYISRQLAEQMGGRLTASSNGKNQGTEFQLSLPLARK